MWHVVIQYLYHYSYFFNDTMQYTQNMHTYNDNNKQFSIITDLRENKSYAFYNIYEGFKIYGNECDYKIYDSTNINESNLTNDSVYKDDSSCSPYKRVCKYNTKKKRWSKNEIRNRIEERYKKLNKSIKKLNQYNRKNKSNGNEPDVYELKDIKLDMMKIKIVQSDVCRVILIDPRMWLEFILRKYPVCINILKNNELLVHSRNSYKSYPKIEIDPTVVDEIRWFNEFSGYQFFTLLCFFSGRCTFTNLITNNDYFYSTPVSGFLIMLRLSCEISFCIINIALRKYDEKILKENPKNVEDQAYLFKQSMNSIGSICTEIKSYLEVFQGLVNTCDDRTHNKIIHYEEPVPSESSIESSSIAVSNNNINTSKNLIKISHMKKKEILIKDNHTTIIDESKTVSTYDNSCENDDYHIEYLNQQNQISLNELLVIMQKLLAAFIECSNNINSYCCANWDKLTLSRVPMLNFSSALSIKCEAVYEEILNFNFRKLHIRGLHKEIAVFLQAISRYIKHIITHLDACLDENFITYSKCVTNAYNIIGFKMNLISNRIEHLKDTDNAFSTNSCTRQTNICTCNKCIRNVFYSFIKSKQLLFHNYGANLGNLFTSTNDNRINYKENLECINNERNKSITELTTQAKKDNIDKNYDLIFINTENDNDIENHELYSLKNSSNSTKQKIYANDKADKDNPYNINAKNMKADTSRTRKFVMTSLFISFVFGVCLVFIMVHF